MGDVVLRLDLKENLPNAFGRADIYGRKRDRGFSELRYMGMDTAGGLVFRRRDVDIITNETSMTRAGLGVTTTTIQPAGNGANIVGVSTVAPKAHVGSLPPDTTQFVIDLEQGNKVTLRDKTVTILSANSNGVTFIVN